MKFQSVSIKNKVLSERGYACLRIVCGYFCAAVEAGVAAAKTVWPAKLDTVSIWPFPEEVYHSCSFLDDLRSSTCPSSPIL